MVFFYILHAFHGVNKLEVLVHELDVVLHQTVEFLFSGQVAVRQSAEFFLVCGEPAVLLEGGTIGKEEQEANRGQYGKCIFHAKELSLCNQESIL